MTNISLSTLFPKMTRSEFLENYLKNEPIVTHNFEFLDSLKSLPFLSSLDSLLEVWPEGVNAYLEGTADEVNSHLISPQQASELFYNEQRGLFFDDPNRFSPEIAESLEGLRAELGLSNMTYARSLIYAIAKGKGTATHFDQNINFVIQISGEKNWWIAPNTDLKNPLERHTLGHNPPGELASYMRSEFPESMPEDAKKYTLKPGSVLFLPRGAWHCTEALSDAISLNFTFTAPAWVDLITAAVRGRLIQSPSWRETANFVNDQELQGHAIARFDELISELSKDVQTWSARDILGATEGH